MNFLFSFFHKKDISWVIIRIEIKMKSSALLPSNSRLGDKFDRSMTLGKLLGNNALATRCGGDIVTLLWFRACVVPSFHLSVRRPCEHDRD